MNRLREGAGGDAGYAILPVLGFAMVVLMLLGVAAHTGDFTLRLTRKTQDVNAAVQAAQGAVQDYLSRVNSDPRYIRYAHVPAGSCPGAPSVANLDPANPLMGPDLVPLPAGTPDLLVRYTIDASRFCTHGVMMVVAHGRSQGVERKLRYTIKQRHYLDYAYFSDLETLNPAKYPATHPWVVNGELNWRCERHHQDPSSPHPATGEVLAPTREWAENGKCAMINWLTDDYVRGDVHSNDALLVCGNPHFDGKVTTSWPGDGSRRHLMNPGCSNDGWFQTNYENQYCPQTFDDACYDAPLPMPLSTTTLKTNPNACVYTGPTRFILDQNLMTVVSPNTPLRSGNDPCRTGSGVFIRHNGLYYVQDVPAGAPSESCSTPDGYQSPQNPVGYPALAGDVTRYACTTGDLFLEGTSRRPATFAADKRVVLTEKIDYNDTEGHTTDRKGTIGLIAGTDVEVYHPVDAAGTNLVIPREGSRFYVRAALLAINGSVLVQNFDQGARIGKLHIRGAVTQRWRGLVGTTDAAHGYEKEYHHDHALRERLPPHFLPAPGSPWRIALTAPLPG